MEPAALLQSDCVDLATADFRGVRLDGAVISHKVLRGASFEGACLRGARFLHCDLSGAVFDGAELGGAMFVAVTATSSRFRAARLPDGYLSHCDLSSADLGHAQLRRCHLRLCSLEQARLDFADVRHAQIVHTSCRDASFVGARLFALIATGTEMRGACFDRAAHFFMTREVIAEILRPHAEGDLEKQKLVSLVQLERRWCYPEWRHLLDETPGLRDVVLQIFERYPDSGFSRALERGATAAEPEPGSSPTDAADHDDFSDTGMVVRPRLEDPA